MTRNNKGYRAVPLSFSRMMERASVRGIKKNAIYCLTEVDVTKPRAAFRRHFDQCRKKVSFTAYIVRCFAEALKRQ